MRRNANPQTWMTTLKWTTDGADDKDDAGAVDKDEESRKMMPTTLVRTMLTMTTTMTLIRMMLATLMTSITSMIVHWLDMFNAGIH
jgi:hypothetical protein